VKFFLGTVALIAATLAASARLMNLERAFAEIESDRPDAILTCSIIELSPIAA
jgi:hypothetical protein